MLKSEVLGYIGGYISSYLQLFTVIYIFLVANVIIGVK